MPDRQWTDERVGRQRGTSTGIRAARIVEIREEPLRSEYSWYASWTTGCDSIYALLCKFAWLNGLSARDVANLFVSSRCGRKGVLVQQLNLDLREPDVFDLPKIAQLCHTTELAVSAAFVRGKYTESLAETCPDLRYCPECLERGFHSALFQLAFVPRCPIHHGALKRQCGHCAGAIPYRLSSSLLRKPFACPHCEGCFATALHAGPRHDLRMSAENHSVLERATDIACTKSRLGSVQQLGRHCSFFGRGRCVLGAPSMQRSKEEYYEFIDAVLHYIMGGRRSAPDAITDDIDPIIPVVQIVRGHDLPRPRIQPWRLLRLSTRRRLLDRGRGHAPRAANLRASRAPLPGSRNSSAGGTGGENPATDLVLTEPDAKLQAIYPVYQAIRRQLFGRVLSAHRTCIRSAAARMGWDVEGDLIARFCPAAEAFLRWRMFWEGFGVPADLFRRPRHVAYGVRAWLCDGAPICAEGWTAQGEQWLTHRVFAMQCVRNFYAWLSHCESAPGRHSHRWCRADVIGSALTYWAAVGSDTSREPLRVFIDTAFRRTVALEEQLCPGEHQAWHRRQLLRLVR